ncbi:MAG TPA: hypothetical protein VFD18_08865, partial [Chthoniobacterales bacterium]|nr:hypothetical protein [Chthoniobacterales bacterium]
RVVSASMFRTVKIASSPDSKTNASRFGTADRSGYKSYPRNVSARIEAIKRFLAIFDRSSVPTGIVEVLELLGKLSA